MVWPQRSYQLVHNEPQHILEWRLTKKVLAPRTGQCPQHISRPSCTHYTAAWHHSPRVLSRLYLLLRRLLRHLRPASSQALCHGEATGHRIRYGSAREQVPLGTYNGERQLAMARRYLLHLSFISDQCYSPRVLLHLAYSGQSTPDRQWPAALSVAPCYRSAYSTQYLQRQSSRDSNQHLHTTRQRRPQ